MKMLLVLAGIVSSTVGFANVETGIDGEALLAAPRRFFVGCRPTVGECAHSCPTRRGQAEIDPRLCDPESSLERFACFCLVREQDAE